MVWIEKWIKVVVCGYSPKKHAYKSKGEERRSWVNKGGKGRFKKKGGKGKREKKGG
jgi:hypothetical protein